MTIKRKAAVLAVCLGLAPLPAMAQQLLGTATMGAQPGTLPGGRGMPSTEGLPPVTPGAKQQPMRITVHGQGAEATAATEKIRQKALESGASLTLEKARAALIDRTNMTFGADYTAPPFKHYDKSMRLIEERPAQTMRGSGTQVEYVAADGRSYLWYPANPRLVPGTWTLKENPFRLAQPEGFAVFNLVNLCFTYPPASPGPGAVAGTSCSPAYSYLRRLKESVAGDVLGLVRRATPPFILERDQTTIDALRQRAGRT